MVIPRPLLLLWILVPVFSATRNLGMEIPEIIQPVSITLRLVSFGTVLDSLVNAIKSNNHSEGLKLLPVLLKRNYTINNLQNFLETLNQNPEGRTKRNLWSTLLGLPSRVLVLLSIMFQTLQTHPQAQNPLL